MLYTEHRDLDQFKHSKNAQHIITLFFLLSLIIFVPVTTHVISIYFKLKITFEPVLENTVYFTFGKAVESSSPEIYTGCAHEEHFGP